jgi:hypothetical protein
MFVTIRLQTSSVCLYGHDFAVVVTLVVHVFPAGAQAVMEHMLVTHSVITVVVVNHLHCFMRCRRGHVCVVTVSVRLLPFQFRLWQFPLWLAFFVFISTAQKQFFQVAGVVLEASCFSLGQLLVACFW